MDLPFSTGSATDRAGRQDVDGGLYPGSYEVVSAWSAPSKHPAPADESLQRHAASLRKGQTGTGQYQHQRLRTSVTVLCPVVSEGRLTVRRMKKEFSARVVRGSSQIGGSCLELEYDGATILLDAGASLGGDDPDVLPVIGAGEPGPAPLAVVITHGHQDHWGLTRLLVDVPRWIGEHAGDILRAACFWGSGFDLGEAGHLRDRVPMQIGPFTVTPFLADHSGFDAYSLLVEAGGRRLFYTGDFRGHGRKACLRRLIAEPPGSVHALVMEGTSLRGADSPAPIDGVADSESKVEHELAESMKSVDGLVVVLSSPQNIDRAVTAYRAALRADRKVGVDLYTADVLHATGRDTIPRIDPEWPRVHAFIPLHQRVKVKESGEFDRTAAVRARRVHLEQMMLARNRWMLLGSYQREIHRLTASGALAGGAVVWSMWDGYLGQTSGLAMKRMLDSHGIPLLHHHTSGHAHPGDLRRLVDALAPELLVPIHTEFPTMYESAFGVPTMGEGDGAWWTV